MTENNALRIFLGESGDYMEAPKYGKLKLFPLTLTDIGDFEDSIGPINEFVRFRNVKANLHLVWLSLRKNGLTDEEIKQQQWKFTDREVGEWFSLGQAEKIRELVERILIISGLVLPKNVQRGGESVPVK